MTPWEKTLFTKFNLLLKGNANVQNGSIKISSAGGKQKKLSLQQVLEKKTSFTIEELVLLARCYCN